MPVLELKLREGRLDDDQLDDLCGRLVEAASEAEGTDLEKVRSMTWTLVDEYGPGEWRVAGEATDNPTYLVRATMVGDLVDDEDKVRFVELVDEAIQAVDPDYNPFAAWVIVNEIPDGNWGAGGAITPAAQVAELTGAELADD